MGDLAYMDPAGFLPVNDRAQGWSLGSLAEPARVEPKAESLSHLAQCLAHGRRSKIFLKGSE